jgi:hypothetical protein
MKRKLSKTKDHEWFMPQMKKFLLGCCDCGLIHWIDFKIVDCEGKNRIIMKAVRARNYTAKQRGKKNVSRKV